MIFLPRLNLDSTFWKKLFNFLLFNFDSVPFNIILQNTIQKRINKIFLPRVFYALLTALPIGEMFIYDLQRNSNSIALIYHFIVRFNIHNDSILAPAIWIFILFTSERWKAQSTLSPSGFDSRLWAKIACNTEF